MAPSAAVQRRNVPPATGSAQAVSAGKRSDEATTATRQHQRISAAALVWLALTCVPTLLGMLLHDPAGRPKSEVLTELDRVFRHYGTLLPLAPFALRFGAYVSLPVQLQDAAGVRQPGAELLLHLLVLMARWLVYILHIMGQKLHVWQAVFGEGQSHLFADHVLLGIAVQASFAVEMAAAGHMWRTVSAARRASKPAQQCSKTRGLLACASALGFCCSMLVSVDTLVTARYFHDAREVLSAVLLGLLLFGALAGMSLHDWTGLAWK